MQKGKIVQRREEVLHEETIVPNAAHVFSDLVGICALQLAQLGATLDLEENFLSVGGNDLVIA